MPAFAPVQAMQADRAAGLFERRKVYAEVPPRVEYSLTEMGQEFRVVLDAVEKWGLDYIKLLEM